jgi:UDP-3-O-[3-hydroxymyristoyl] glucosamine N-acyltransferase
VIEDDVENGSNVSIDRGTLEDTWIGPRVRIDNLVHVAHNVSIGADAAIVAHAMLCGSSSVGERAWIAPCATLREGVSVGVDAVVGTGAVVNTSVDDGVTVAGSPARELPYVRSRPARSPK